MKTFEYTIKDELGIHARPAGMLERRQKKKFCIGMHHHKRWKNEKTDSADDADVTWCKQGDTVTVAANGEDEDAAIETLKAFFEANL